MLRAVLEILYAGVGSSSKFEDMARDPMVEVLSVVSNDLLDIDVRYLFSDVLHVDDFLQVALSDQG